MVIFAPIGWQPADCEAVRHRFPPGCALTLPADGICAPHRRILEVIYWVVAGRAPTAAEYRENSPEAAEARERAELDELAGELYDLAQEELPYLFEQIRYGAVTVTHDWRPTGPLEFDASVWYTTSNGWRILVDYHIDDDSLVADLARIREPGGEAMEITRELREAFRDSSHCFKAGGMLESAARAAGFIPAGGWRAKPKRPG
jgi:hypothetical protein